MLCDLRLQALPLLRVPLFHQTSLEAHIDTVMKNLEMVTTEH